MRHVLVTILLTSVGAFADSPDAPTVHQLVGTWVGRMTKDPARTGREIADYFVRLPEREWKRDFAVELRLFELFALLDRVERGATSPHALAELRAVGLDPHTDPLGHANALARAFLVAAWRIPSAPIGKLGAILMRFGGPFWTNRLVEDLMERSPLRTHLLELLPHVPMADYQRVARAIGAAQYDVRDPSRYLNALVLPHAWAMTPLGLDETNDPRADRHCARLLDDTLLWLANSGKT